MSQPHQPADLVQGSRFEVAGDQYQPSLIILDWAWWEANEYAVHEWMAAHLPKGTDHHMGVLINFGNPRERMMFLLRWS
jgi:hypothetical protein